MPINADQLLRQVIEIAPLAVVALDQQRCVNQWNAAAERIFGWPAAEVMGRPAPMLAEAQRDQLNGLIEQGLAGDTRTPLELRCLRKDGSPVDVSLWAAPLRGETGEFVGRVEIFMDVTEQRRMQEALRESEARLRNGQEVSRPVSGVATDITERKRLEQRLRESEARYRGLVEQIPAIIYIAPGNAPGVALYISPQIERILGVPANAFLREPEVRIRQLHPDDRERVLAQLAEASASRRAFACDYRMIARDGRTVWIRDEGNFICDETGKPTALQGIMLDITELKRAESALDDSRKRLQALFDNIRDGILLVDRNARHVDANPALCELLGYSREEMLRMALWDDVPPHLRADLYGLWSKFLTVGRLEGEFTVQRKDGSAVEVEYRAVAHFMPDLHLCTVRDITARRRAEDELKDYATHLKSLSRRLVEVQESERKTLARELHDQTGQNLTAINLHLSMIREQFSPLTESAIRARVEDSMALVASTVDAVRNVMSNLRPPVLEDYGLLAGLQWYGEIFSQRAGLPVRISGEEPSPRLAPVAETALFRIAQEALTNVLKHANASRVEIALEGGPQRARLTIIDDGRGFDVAGERRARAGWGLLTMQERVEAVGGFLQLYSTPGCGTRVVVEVPPGE